MSKKPLFRCEEFKLLGVIGEDRVQVVSTTKDILKFPAIAILEIDAALLNVTDHIFTDKVLKQGLIQKRIQYASRCSIKRCQLIEVPFSATAHIPGVDRDLEIETQNRLVLVETDYQLLDPYTLEVKVILEINVKASTYVQRKLKVCTTNVISHSLISG